MENLSQKIIAFSFCVCTCCFSAQRITFLDLDNSSLEGKEVNMVGFLIQNEHNEWFLAKQPNIKTCCMDKHQKIRLQGEFPSDLINQVIVVEGLFQKNKTLKNANLIQK